jgi:hypothetical protein
MLQVVVAVVSGADVTAKKDINTLSVEELSSVLDKMDEAVSFVHP